jgi:D-alanyl-D-alanine carboxypeptidase
MRKNLSLVAGIILVLAVGTLVLLQFDKDTDKTNTAKQSASKQASNTNAAPGFDKSAYSQTDPNSIWVIVNKKHPLQPINYAPTDLTSVGNNQVMRVEAAQALSNMFAGAKAAGTALQADSAYRSYPTQVSVYNAEVKAYGQARADSESARPGYSEHQTGLAVDIGGDGCHIADCFATTTSGKWAAANAYKYGFILRYPADKVTVTGYRYEPWHFRYVGVSLATEMHNQGIETLEEFFGVSGGDY